MIKFQIKDKYVLFCLKCAIYAISSIFLIPFAFVFSTILDCRSNDGINYFLDIDHKITCFTGVHIVQIIFAILGIVGLIVISYMVFAFDNEINFKCSLVFKKFSPNSLFLINLAVLKLVLLNVFVNHKNIEMEYCCLNLVILVLVFYSINNTPIFFNMDMCKIIVFFWSTYLFGAISLLFEYIFPTGTALNWFVLSCLPIAFYVATIELKFFKIKRMHIKMINNESELSFHLQSLIIFIQQCYEKNDSLPLINVIYHHRTLCDMETCSLKNVLCFENIKSERKELDEIIFSNVCAFVCEQYIQVISDYPENKEFKLHYCLFLAQFMKQSNLAFENLIRFEKDEHFNLVEGFSFFCIKELLFGLNSKNNSKSMESFESDASFRSNLNNEFQTAIEKLTYLSLDFWENIKQDQVDYRKMVNLNSNFISEYKKVQNIIENRTISSKTELKLYFVYSRFLYLILGETCESNDLLQELLNKLRQLNDIQNTNLYIGPNFNFEDLFFPALLVNVSDKLKIEIIKVNVEMEVFLGYNPHEITQIPIEVVIPEFFRNTHEQILSKYLKNIEKKDKYRKKFVLALKKNGYVVPFIANMKYIENSISDSRYIFCGAISDSIFDNSFYIILDSKFCITNVSENCIAEFQMNTSKTQKNSNVKFWFSNLFEFISEFKSTRFTQKLEIKNLKSGTFEKNDNTLYHIEATLWDLFLTDEFKCLILKLDKVKNMDKINKIQEFSITDIHNYKLKDKTMEGYLNEAKIEQNFENEISSKANFKEKKVKIGDLSLQASNKLIGEEFFFKNIKLLKMKKNRLFEIDYTQIDNFQDKEILEDEFEQFCIYSSLENNKNTETSFSNDKEQVIKFDFSHKKKFKRFIELYHKNFSVLSIIIFSFLSVFIYFGFVFGNIKIDNYATNSLIAFENINILIMQKLDNFVLTVQDIQVATILNKNSLTVPDANYYAISQRMRDRIANIRNCSQYIFDNQNLFNRTLNVSITEINATTVVFDLYILEQRLLSKMTQLSDPNIKLDTFQSALTTKNNITFFIIDNVINNYYPASMILINQLNTSKTTFLFRIKLLNVLIKSLPVTLIVLFIGMYCYYLYSTNAKNLLLLTIFLQVPDDLIEKQISQIQKLLIIIKKIIYEENLHMNKAMQSQSAAKTKTIYRKKLFKNQKHLFNWKLILIIFVPIIFMASYNFAEFYVDMYYSDIADYLISKGYTPGYKYKILTDFNVVLWANLPYQLMLNQTQPKIALNKAGMTMSTTMNMIYYEFVQANSQYSLSYSMAFSNVLFGNICKNNLIYNSTLALGCENRFKEFGMPAISTVLNVMENFFYSLQNDTFSNKITNSTFSDLLKMSEFKR